MNQQINAMQESIKIALDAADAATDVTSEYKRIKNEHIKAEQKVKEIHKYTTIVFSSSIATAVIAIDLHGGKKKMSGEQICNCNHELQI